MNTTVQYILRQSPDYKIPRLDLEILLAEVLECTRSRLYSHPEEVINKTKLTNLRRLARSRYKGTPLAYLIKCKEFYGRNFYVDNRVLIPRPETEQIIDIAKKINVISPRVLDIGTGSGVIGITLGLELLNPHITALDICTEALDVAKINADRLGTEVNFMQSDLLAAVEQGSQFHIITANLPYIGDRDFVSTETKEHEPNQALYGGGDGLDLYRRLFNEIKSKDIRFKMLIGEFGFGQAKKIGELLDSNFRNFDIKEDLSGIPRIFVVKS